MLPHASNKPNATTQPTSLTPPMLLLPHTCWATMLVEPPWPKTHPLPLRNLMLVENVRRRVFERPTTLLGVRSLVPLDIQRWCWPNGLVLKNTPPPHALWCAHGPNVTFPLDSPPMQVHPPWEPALQPLVLQRLSGLGVGPDLDTNLLVVEPMKAGLAFPMMLAVAQRARLSNWDPTVLGTNNIIG